MLLRSRRAKLASKGSQIGLILERRHLRKERKQLARQFAIDSPGDLDRMHERAKLVFVLPDSPYGVQQRMKFVIHPRVLFPSRVLCVLRRSFLRLFRKGLRHPFCGDFLLSLRLCNLLLHRVPRTAMRCSPYAQESSYGREA